MNKDLRFLVVDDYATMRRLIRCQLQDIGYSHIAEADNGSSALAMLQSAPFDMVLTDWNMPSMPGLALLKAIRADDRMKELPVLMVTAEAKRDQIIAAAQAGVSGYLIKPFTAAVIKQKVERILQMQAAAAA